MRLCCLFVLSASLVGWSTATAQPPPVPKEGLWVIPLTITPTGEPKPALKYRLLPEARDLNPGNQIPAFYKCFMEQHNFYRNKESIDKREKWVAAPLRELATEKELIGYGGSSTRQAAYAARLESVDWAVLQQLKVEGIYLLLPDVQQLRELAQVLKVKMRAEIARGEFDNAVHTAQTLLALGRAFESHSTLIGQLVGFAITNLTFDALEEFVSQPGAPNLYWALVDLPTPFISLRHGMDGERAWVGKENETLGLPEPIAEDQLKKIAGKLDPIIQLSEGLATKKTSATEWYQQQLADPAAVKAATERLLDLGFPKDKLSKLSPLQIIMADDFKRYEVYRDEVMKWTNLPISKIPAGVFTAKPPRGVFVEFVPAVLKVKQSQARIQQRIDLLLVEEAVRLYAAANGGKLPPSLDSIALPLPTDPISGKPYVYKLKDGNARIRSTPPPDRAKEPSSSRVLEITVRK